MLQTITDEFIPDMCSAVDDPSLDDAMIDLDFLRELQDAALAERQDDCRPFPLALVCIVILVSQQTVLSAHKITLL